MLRLSIVIPCIQEACCFENTLASVLQNRPGDCEVLVVQPRPYDDPYDLTGEVRFVEAPGNSSLIDLINLGFEHARGDIVQLLSCDVEVGEGWSEPAMSHFDSPTVASVSPLIVARERPGHILARGVQYSPSGLRIISRPQSARRTQLRQIVGPTYLGGCYSRDAWQMVGGFCSVLGEFADIDLGLMLQAAGFRCVHEPQSVLTSVAGPATSLSMTGGSAAETLYWRNTGHSNWTSCLVHPAAWLIECLKNLHRPKLLWQVLGRLNGWRNRSAHGPHREHLRGLQSQPVANQNQSLHRRTAA